MTPGVLWVQSWRPSLPCLVGNHSPASSGLSFCPHRLPGQPFPFSCGALAFVPPGASDPFPSLPNPTFQITLCAAVAWRHLSITLQPESLSPFWNVPFSLGALSFIVILKALHTFSVVSYSLVENFSALQTLKFLIMGFVSCVFLYSTQYLAHGIICASMPHLFVG